MKRIAGVIARGIVVAASASCGGDGDSASDSSTRTSSERDSAGVRIVESAETGIWTEATRWTVEKDLEIGVVDGTEEYQFGSIVDVDADDDGRMYVLDRKAGNVRVYDAQGAFLFSFGRFGEGPGEFSSRTEAILVRWGGRILVPDMGLRRASLFRRDGTFLRSFPLPYPNVRPPGEWATLGEGGYLNHLVNSDWAGLVRYDEQRQIADSVVEFSPGRAMSREEAPSWPVLPQVPVWTVSGDAQILSGFSDRYRIEVRGAEGNLEMIISKEPEMELVPAAERQELADRAREGARAALADHADHADVAWWESRYPRSAFVPPDRAPIIMKLAAGPEGTIWVQRAPPPESISAETLKEQFLWRATTESPRWDVFSRTGRFLGDVILPPRFTVRRIRDSYIYGTARGEWDVERVVRLGISRGR